MAKRRRAIEPPAASEGNKAKCAKHAPRSPAAETTTTSPQIHTQTDVDDNAASRLLALPGELRNNIWELVAEDSVVSLDKRKRGKLSTTAPLAATYKQIRREFLDFSTSGNGTVIAVVRDFDFSHVVAFARTMSEREKADTATEQQYRRTRHVHIRLVVSPHCLGRLHHLETWLDRTPPSSGDSIRCTYELSSFDLFVGDCQSWLMLYDANGAYLRTSGTELAVIQDLIAQRALSEFGSAEAYGLAFKGFASRARAQLRAVEFP